jgi:hypothetical protein
LGREYFDLENFPIGSLKLVCLHQITLIYQAQLGVYGFK